MKWTWNKTISVKVDYLAMFFPSAVNLLRWKYHLNNYWTGEKLSFFFPKPIPPVGLLRLQYYQRCEPMILKFGWKVNLFCKKHVFITYWPEKRIRKFIFLRYSFFWKCTVTVNLKKFSLNIIFREYTFGKFYIANFK